MENPIEKQKLKILFFASDPSDESRLNLGKELQSIREKLKDNPDFELRDHLATKQSDFLNEIMIYKPQIVHFSGHGTKEGELKFEDELGNARSIPPDALASLFSLTKDFVKCVIVNTCYAEAQAKAIAKFIPVVIGTKSEISDDAAISFSSGFYTALSSDLSTESIEKAFNLGNVAIQFSVNSGDIIRPIIMYGTPNVRFAAEVDTAFNLVNATEGKAVQTLINGLKLTGKKMELSEQAVNNIIDERIFKTKVYHENLLIYEKNLKDILRDEFPLSASSLGALSVLQTGLNLSNDDVKSIQDRILKDSKLDSAFSWYDRGRGQVGIKNFDLAINYFTKAIEKNNEYSAAFHERGNCYKLKNEFLTAIKDFTKAIEINKNWEILSNLSSSYFERGYACIELITDDMSFIENGIKDFLKVIDINPTENSAYYNLALGYARLHDFKLAAKWYIEALEHGYSDKINIYSGIVKCYSELNENDKREEWLTKFQNDPDFSDMIVNKVV